MAFKKKRNTNTGVTSNQLATKVQKLFNSYGINYVYKIAQTGTFYFYVTIENDKTYKVRVSDHADAYENSDFNVDGFLGGMNELEDWLKTFAVKKRKESKTHYAYAFSTATKTGELLLLKTEPSHAREWADEWLKQHKEKANAKYNAIIITTQNLTPGAATTFTLEVDEKK